MFASPSRSFRASVSRSYRVYNLLARFIDSHWVDTDGNDYGQAVVSTLRDDFTPEKVTGYELGYMEQWKKLGLMLDLRLFREELEDSGTDERVGGVAYWLDEGGGWDTEGLDVQLDYRPNDNTRLVGAYSYAEIDGDTDKPLDDTVPRHTLSMQLSHRFNPDWHGSLAVYHMDEVKWLGAGSEVDAYTRVDLKLSRNLSLGEGDGQLSLIVHNLADDEYNEFRVPGRHDRYGNTTSGTLPILFHELRAAGRVRAGSLVAFTAFGAGAHWGAALYRQPG